MKFMRFGLLLGFLFTPALAFAASSGFLGPIVPACSEGGDGMCQACNLVQLGENILRAMVTLGVFATAIMFAYAGFLYVTAASNHSHIDSAKKIFFNSLIGLVFILAAYLIVDLTLKVFTGQPLSTWSSIQCVSKSNSGGGVNVQFNSVPDGSTPTVTGSQGGGQNGGQNGSQNGGSQQQP